MQLNPTQRVYQILCSTTGNMLCALDASNFDEAQERTLHILETEPSVTQPIQNVRILILPPDDIANAPIYYPHAYFLMQDLRRRAAMH